jgi:putative nucleotidyltransferase with HDIG domain
LAEQNEVPIDDYDMVGYDNGEYDYMEYEDDEVNQAEATLPSFDMGSWVDSGKRGLSSAYRDWREIPKEIRKFPQVIDDKMQEIESALVGYRLEVMDYTFKAMRVDRKIWSLYKHIMEEEDRLTWECFKRRRKLFMRSSSQLRALLGSWKDLYDSQVELLDAITRGPRAFEFYNKMMVSQEMHQEIRVIQQENTRRLDEAYNSLEKALAFMSKDELASTLAGVDTRLLSLEDAQAYWNMSLATIREKEKLVAEGYEDLDDILDTIYALQKAIYAAPATAEAVIEIEKKYTILLRNHEILESFGQPIIPNDEIQRTRTLIDERVPLLWARSQNEELETTLTELEHFIELYEPTVLAQISYMQRRRPGLIPSQSSLFEGSNQFIPLVRTLVSAIEAREPAMRGHSDAVARMAVKMARKMKYNEVDLEQIEIAALLHDVGKILIPEAVLAKDQPLTPQEILILQKHPMYGAKILKPIENLRNIIPDNQLAQP